jgi:hypothetical protein
MSLSTPQTEEHQILQQIKTQLYTELNNDLPTVLVDLIYGYVSLLDITFKTDIHGRSIMQWIGHFTDGIQHLDDSNLFTMHAKLLYTHWKHHVIRIYPVSVDIPCGIPRAYIIKRSRNCMCAYPRIPHLHMDSVLSIMYNDLLSIMGPSNHPTHGYNIIHPECTKELEYVLKQLKQHIMCIISKSW